MSFLTRRRNIESLKDAVNPLFRVVRRRKDAIPEEFLPLTTTTQTTTDKDAQNTTDPLDNAPGDTSPPNWWTDWEHWTSVRCPRMLSVKPAWFHREAWDWFTSLERGVAPYAYIAPWGRGLGKTSTVEAAVAFLEEAQTRDFILYVCANQEAANEHLATIATILEAREDRQVERLTNRFGHSRGYSQSKLRIRRPDGSVFNVLAFGLDGVRRGLKLDNQRPDFIALDDIDDYTDTAAEALRMFRVITRTIIPTGSNDCAICFIQNPIHPNSVMARLLRGEFKGLMRRKGGKAVPSLLDFEYEEIIVGGQPEYRITSGVPVWEGFSVHDAEVALNKSGPDAFKAEYLHIFNASGLLFFNFKETREGRPWHVQDSSLYPIQPHWKIFGSHDYGETAPCASYLYARDEHGDIYVIAENYQAGLDSQKQAGWFALLLWRLGLGQPKIKNEFYGEWETRLKYIAFDHANTFRPLSGKEVKSEYPVDIWHRMGLKAIRSDKDRIAGWRMMNQWFGAVRAFIDPQGILRVKPRVIIFGDRCPNLVRLLPLAPVDEDDPRELDKSYESHGLDSYRYFTMSLYDEPVSLGSQAISQSNPEDPFRDEYRRGME